MQASVRTCTAMARKSVQTPASLMHWKTKQVLGNHLTQPLVLPAHAMPCVLIINSTDGCEKLIKKVWKTKHRVTHGSHKVKDVTSLELFSWKTRSIANIHSSHLTCTLTHKHTKWGKAACMYIPACTCVHTHTHTHTYTHTHTHTHIHTHTHTHHTLWRTLSTLHSSVGGAWSAEEATFMAEARRAEPSLLSSISLPNTIIGRLADENFCIGTWMYQRK